jgi:hypothetical protein
VSNHVIEWRYLISKVVMNRRRSKRNFISKLDCVFFEEAKVCEKKCLAYRLLVLSVAITNIKNRIIKTIK